MALRSGHGAGGKVPRIEVLPPDEIPAGIPGETSPAPLRNAKGQLMKSPGTTAMAGRAGKAAVTSRQLGRLLGLESVDEAHPWAKYARLAREWRDDHMAQLAALVGGGEVGPGPASIVSSAALQLAASRYMSDQGAAAGDVKLLAQASQLANDSRQNLLAAHELVAKEAKARPKRKSTLAALLEGDTK